MGQASWPACRVLCGSSVVPENRRELPRQAGRAGIRQRPRLPLPDQDRMQRHQSWSRLVRRKSGVAAFHGTGIPALHVLQPEKRQFEAVGHSQLLEQAAVVPGEEDELNARHARAAHRRRLLEIAAACQQGLTEGESPVTEQLHPLLRFLNELAEIDPGRGAEFVRRLEEPITALQNLSLDLESYAESLDLEETELEQLESRIGLLQKLKRKYGPTLTEVLAAAATFRERLAGAEKRTERLAELSV